MNLTKEHLDALARPEFTNEELQTAWDGLLTPHGKRIAKQREQERNHDKMARKSVTIRTAERLIRSAYDFEELAGRLRSEGHERYADGIKDISRKLGDMGHNLKLDLEGRNE
ncbi:hypothetical protein [Phyllobacterium sp. P5_D12]